MMVEQPAIAFGSWSTVCTAFLVYLHDAADWATTPTLSLESFQVKYTHSN